MLSELGTLDTDTGKTFGELEVTEETQNDKLKVEVSRVERTFWDSIKDSTNPAMFDAYLNQYPDGVFAELAMLLAKTLRENTGEN